MSLTGTPFLVTAIVLAVIAVLLPLALWSRLPGPAVVRNTGRLGMVLFAQLTAVVAVFVPVNNANNLYESWDDLLGTGDHVTAAADLGPDGTGGKRVADLPKVRQSFEPADDPVVGDGVRRTTLKGRISGVEAEVYVWLPPQYDDPAYRDKKFPVVEVLNGFPGSPKAWFGSMRSNQQLEPLMRNGKVAPFILVAPRTTLLGDTDTGCANIPGKVNADSWLSVDVRKMVVDNFRVTDRADDWAVAGYSAGAHCAMKLAVAHPDRYRYAIALSGYTDPAAERASLTGKDPKLRHSENPLNMFKLAKTPPRISMLFTGDGFDGYNQGIGFQEAAEPPTRIDVHRVVGGHRMDTWREQVPSVFRWLTKRYAADAAAEGRDPLPGPVTGGGTERVPGVPGGRDGGPGAGTGRPPGHAPGHAPGAGRTDGRPGVAPAVRLTGA